MRAMPRNRSAPPGRSFRARIERPKVPGRPKAPGPPKTPARPGTLGGLKPLGALGAQAASPGPDRTTTTVPFRSGRPGGASDEDDERASAEDDEEAHRALDPERKAA